jgi:hypothetical protein
VCDTGGGGGGGEGGVASIGHGFDLDIRTGFNKPPEKRKKWFSKRGGEVRVVYVQVSSLEGLLEAWRGLQLWPACYFIQGDI